MSTWETSGARLLRYAAASADAVLPGPSRQERLREAAKLGFGLAVVPKVNAPKMAFEGPEIHAVGRIEQAMDVARGLELARADRVGLAAAVRWS